MVQQLYGGALWLILATSAAAQNPPVHEGVAIMRDSARGNCTICHLIPGAGLPEEAQGTLGPPLAGVGRRLSRLDIRARIHDARAFNPATLMPPYGTTAGLTDVSAASMGRAILQPAEIDALADYLSGLTE